MSDPRDFAAPQDSDSARAGPLQDGELEPAVAAPSAFDLTTQYRCDACGGIFDCGWSEEEAKAEREKNGWTDIECGVVCDDCYKAMGFK